MKKYILILLFSLLSLNLYSQDSIKVNEIDSIRYTFKTMSKITVFDTLIVKTIDIKLKKDEIFWWTWKKGKTIERILWTEGAVLTYGILDYIGYNLFKNSNIEFYRSFQGSLFVGLNELLRYKFGISSSLSFSIQVFSGVPDMYYYGIDGLSKGFGGFSKGNEWSKTNNFNHFNFTPDYYLCGGENRMHKVDVWKQVLIGKSISVILVL